MARTTNTEFITDLMEFSRNGPMIQVFVLQALEIYAKTVIERQDEIDENGFISRRLWVSCAEEVKAKIEERENEH